MSTQVMFTEDRIGLMIMNDASMSIRDPIIIGRGGGIGILDRIRQHGPVAVLLRLNVQTPRVVKCADSLLFRIKILEFLEDRLSFQLYSL